MGLFDFTNITLDDSLRLVSFIVKFYCESFTLWKVAFYVVCSLHRDLGSSVGIIINKFRRCF